jgi:serine/threonine protein kinase
MAIEYFPPTDSYSSFEPIIANEKTDVWAFGMTVYASCLRNLFILIMTIFVQEILTGERPFEHLAGDVFVILAISRGELPPVPEDLDTKPDHSWKLWELCKKCWTKKPRLRPSMSDILKHVNKYRNAGNSQGSEPPVAFTKVSLGIFVYVYIFEK